MFYLFLTRTALGRQVNRLPLPLAVLVCFGGANAVFFLLIAPFIL